MSKFTAESSVAAEVVPSPNHNERRDGRKPDMLVLHYTGMLSAQMALEKLCSAKSEVSAHYFVFEDGHIVQSVPEARRAWHAGVSSWQGETDINSCSIGIEIANPGHDHDYRDFPKRQIAALTALCRGILTRYHIPPDRVLGHSDVAPSRKRDPGEKFPWRTLADSGVGTWLAPAPIRDGGAKLSLGDENADVVKLQKGLADYGYGIENTGIFDPLTQDVVLAFQRHFRPALVDGIADASTVATLRALLKAAKKAYA
jgi:N-acetylmuramoyl-L-alanine amidase